MDMEITPIKNITCNCEVPGDHNMAVIASLIASLSEGDTELKKFPAHKEGLKMLSLLEMLGVKIDRLDNGKRIIIHGKGRNGWRKPDVAAVDIQNSETMLKLLTGALVGQSFESCLKGDTFFSMIPMDEIILPLKKMNAGIQAEEDRHMPFCLEPSDLKAVFHELHIMDANTKSCILLAGLFARGETQIIESYASCDHMERMLSSFGASIDFKTVKEPRRNEDELERRIRLANAKKDKKTEKKPAPYQISLEGGVNLKGIEFAIPGDITLAVNLIVLASNLKKSEIIINNVNLNPSRSGALAFLKRMGADIEIINRSSESGHPVGDIVAKSAKLHARKFTGDDMVNIIDEVPAIAVAAAFAKGRTVIRDIERLRNIDADCITGLTENLRSMGVKVGELPDGLVIDGEPFYQGGTFNSYNDSRIAMAFSVAGLLCRKKTTIINIEPLHERYPEFYEKIQKTGCYCV